MTRMAFVSTTSIAAVGLAFGLWTTPAAAAVDIPCRTAKLVVPYKPGGGTDIIFRIFAEAANKAGATPKLQVVNIAGQSGTKGAKTVRSAKPDGCTLLAHHEALITTFVSGQNDFTWDAFEPVAILTYTPYVLGARGNAPYNNLTELITAAKKLPGEISVGVTIASTSHFLTLIIEDRAGVKFKNVPYEGTRAKVTALLAKNIDLGALDVISAKKYIEQGTIKVLASATAERDPLIPQVPTLKEQGLDLIYGLHRGILAPRGTHEDVVKHWEGVFAKAARDPSIVGDLKKKGTTVNYADGSGFAALMKEQTEVFSKLAKSVGLTK